jgi:hypothetical protein
VLPPVLEAQSRSGGDVLDGAGHEDLAGCRRALNPGSDVDGDPTQSPALQLAFAGMDARADLKAESLHGGADGAGALDGAGGRLEAHEKAVAGGVDLEAFAPHDLSPDHRPVLIEELPPARVAESAGVIRRTHDVGEEERGEDPFGLDRRAPLPPGLLDERPAPALRQDEDASASLTLVSAMYRSRSPATARASARSVRPSQSTSR